jgi:malonyl-CoA O-methyltransferase
MKPAMCDADISFIDAQTNVAAKRVKNKIAKRFSDAAQAYDKGAEVQQKIADYFLQWSSLPLINDIDAAEQNAEVNNEVGQVCVDIGCGTGYLGKQVGHRFIQWLNVDLAKGMLCVAREHSSADAAQRNAFIVGDAEQLPFGDNTMNAALSSMALQWCRSPQAVMKELYRVLMQNGTAALAIMVSPSFHSLSQAWQSQNMPSRINTFATADDWLDAVHSLQWQVRSHRACFHSEHESVSAMLRSIKTVGANVRVEPRQQTTFSKTEFQSLSTYFQGRTRHVLEYEVLFLECNKEDSTP